MTDETDTYARELIRMFAASLRDLNGGAPIPDYWRQQLSRELGPPAKRGIKPNARVVARKQGWARDILAARLAIESSKASGGISRVAESLAEEASKGNQTFTASDVFNAAREYEVFAMSEEVFRRLQDDDAAEERARRERAAVIQRRRAAGEPLDDILADPSISIEMFAAIRGYQDDSRRPPEGAPARPTASSYADRQRAILEWLSVGLGLGVGNDPPPLLNLNRASRKGTLPTRLSKKKPRG